MHFGIARTALIAWLDARTHRGKLLLRIEDLDTPRVIPGSAEDIQHDLRWLGLEWDGPPSYQSQRNPLYKRALLQLQEQDLIYPCTCSRKEIRESSAPHGAADDGPRYPGTCRQGARSRPGRTPSLRFRTPEQHLVEHVDRRVGYIKQDVNHRVGDFVLRRADQLWAYQLAVTVDDLDQGITCIVRGEDLLDSTPRQMLLRKTLQPLSPPMETLHVPLMLDVDGRRLAKRAHSYSIAEARSHGQPPEMIIGQLAASLGLLPHAKPIRPQELLPRWQAQLSENT
ncbi:MAG: tRNA glutamyl-Q(34) synthetase GluQRS [Myxococcales bacterium]|nr:tRNA glutamyl-Q(34) synthetase GluQRS [Myxococcales bacterium]